MNIFKKLFGRGGSDDWPFGDPQNLAVITTRQVVEQGYPILLVTHDEDDGGWQILCGTTNDEEDAMVVSLKSLVARDPSLKELADLPLGGRAWRDSSEQPWKRERG